MSRNSRSESRLEKSARESAVAVLQDGADSEAVRAKTARLRALRLEKEAADAKKREWQLANSG